MTAREAFRATIYFSVSALPVILWAGVIAWNLIVGLVAIPVVVFVTMMLAELLGDWAVR